MTGNPHFISLEDALFFHAEEIKKAGGSHEIRDMKALEAALAAPQATYRGTFLMDLFEIAATYIESICTRHPFLDGNKRTAVACALVFLYLNGYEVYEGYEEELADMVLSVVTHKVTKTTLAEYFRDKSRIIE